MAGNIDGYFHDNVLVRGSEMAKITNALAGQKSYVVPGYAQSMNITTSGLNITVQPGFAVIQGYPVVIKQPMTLSLPANSTGYIVITIDKSKDVSFEGDPNDPSSYTWENNQVSLEYVSALVIGDLSNDDSLHTFSLARVNTNATTATTIKDGASYSGNTTIFSGVSLMNAAASYSFDPKLMKKGITFVTTTFNDSTGQALNANKQEFFISRTSLDKLSITGHTFQCVLNDGRTATKYVYINMQTGLVQGHANNGVGDSRNFVFREIFMEQFELEGFEILF